MPRGAADPRLAIWAYPWDVLDVGPDSVSRELRERALEQLLVLACAHDSDLVGNGDIPHFHYTG